MGNSQTINKINFEDMQFILKTDQKYLIINTLGEQEQSCLLPKTVKAHEEVELLTNLLKIGRKDVRLVVYGRNCNDDKAYAKYNQLLSLGFSNVSVYPGGLFEWLLLQDIFGAAEFPTTKKELDLLKYKPSKRIGVQLLEY
jgi:hypothetical protein